MSSTAAGWRAPDPAGLLRACSCLTPLIGIKLPSLQVAARFADGAWLAELAPVRDPAQVGAVVAAALGIPEQSGTPPADTLARALAGQQLLLVLDNCASTCLARPRSYAPGC